MGPKKQRVHSTLEDQTGPMGWALKVVWVLACAMDKKNPKSKLLWCHAVYLHAAGCTTVQVTYDYFTAMKPRFKARIAKDQMEIGDEVYWNAIAHYVDLGRSMQGNYPRFYLDPGGETMHVLVSCLCM